VDEGQDSTDAATARVSRRALLAGSAALLATGATGDRWAPRPQAGTGRPDDPFPTGGDDGSGADPQPRGADAIRAENDRPGATDWTIADGDARPRGIEGFTDRVSVERGERVRLYVRSAAPTFRVLAYRMGFYAHRGARLVWTSDDEDVPDQPPATVDADTNMVDCSHWVPSLTIDVDSRWTPGQYLLKLVPSTGSETFVPLVVRDDDHASDVLIVSDVTTVQAYNTWGGHSLYGDERGTRRRRATVVSFDRPYGQGWAQAGAILGDTFEVGMMCESMGLDVTYTTNIDQHARPELMRRHRVIVSGAHDEYYSLEMRDGLEAARDEGVNIVFLGANAVYRRIRLDRSPLGPHRRQVNYRSADADPLDGIDPERVTTAWRESPARRPESALTGTYYESNEPGLSFPMVIVDPDAWMFAGTGVTAVGHQWPDAVREEYDRVTPSAPTPRRLQVLAHSPVVCQGRRSYADMTYYTVPSGAGVFSAGTLLFEPRLGPVPASPASDADEPDAQVRRMMANILTEFARGPAGRRRPARPNLDRLDIA